MQNFIDELSKRGYEVTVNDSTTQIKARPCEHREDKLRADRLRTSPATVRRTFTTHLHDATMVKCLVNAYGSRRDSRQTIDKLEGRSVPWASRTTWSDHKWHKL